MHARGLNTLVFVTLFSEVGAYDVLLIDGLMEDLRDPLAKIWTTSETASAVYPPPSLHVSDTGVLF